MKNTTLTESVSDIAISEVIKNRILKDGGTFLANDNISKYIRDDELDALQKEVQHKMQDVLESLIIDTENDHNTNETAKRVAKMYIKEVFKGRYVSAPDITDFPNAKGLKDMYTLGPIDFKSACSHHLVPIIGKCWVGIIPGEKVVGISKVSRLVEWVSRRPHIQEEAAIILRDKLKEVLKPQGLIIVIKAQHMCMTWRGVNQESTSMVNSVIDGIFMANPAAKQEFFEVIKGQGYING